MKKFLIILLVLPQLLFSQSWVDDMHDSQKNFYDIQVDFESFWKNKVFI